MPHAFPLRVLHLDNLHGLIDGLAEILTFRQLQEGAEPRRLWKIKDSASLVVRLPDLSTAARFIGFCREFLMRVPEAENGRCKRLDLSLTEGLLLVKYSG